MPKNKFFKNVSSSDSAFIRERTRTLILNRYYNLYLNAYEFSGDIDYQASEFILKRLWADGQIAGFVLKEATQDDKFKKGLPVFTPFAPNNWNIYDYPVTINLINTKGVKFIPVGPQLVDRDAVICYAQKNRKSVFSFVDYYATRMTDILMVIRVNLKTMKMPWLIGGTPESHAKLRDLFEKLDNDDPELFVDSDDIDKFKALVSGAPYNIDKLYNYYCALESELREYLGLSNLGLHEKKEHLITSEIQVNNEVVEANKECLFEGLKAFCERMRNTFGVSLEVKLKEREQLPEDLEEVDDEEEEIEDDMD